MTTMNFYESYSEQELENKAQTDELNYKCCRKLINSDTEISNISSIWRQEEENKYENESDSDCSLENKNEKNKYFLDEKSEEYDEKTHIEKSNIFPQKEKGTKATSSSKEKKNINNTNYYTFTWDEGGNDIKITGSFCDWKIQFQMDWDQKDSIFKIQLPLENKVYQYKFIVDGEWKYSSKFPTTFDNIGNINNFLDNTQKELALPNIPIKNNIKKNKKTKKAPKKRKNSIKTKTEKTRASTINNKKKSIKVVKKKSTYESEYPSEEDKQLISLPHERYYESFKMDNYTNQNSIGNQNYYDYSNRYCLSYTGSIKPIFSLGHVNINHLILAQNKSNIHKNSMCFRYRGKASTFIYYK